MDLNIEITIMDAEEFAELWELLDEMIIDSDVPQEYRVRLKGIRTLLDAEGTAKKFPEN